MQFHYLPVDERFFVRFTQEASARYPAGAFSTVGNYPVYAMRVRADRETDVTEFLIPASDGNFLWVDMRHAMLARRS